MTVTINLGPLDHLNDPHEVTRALADQVRQDTDQFVPYRQGNLANDTVSMIDMGSTYQLVYGAVYAHRLYKHPEYNFFHGEHTEAGGQWFERSKQQNMANWEQFVKGELLK